VTAIEPGGASACIRAASLIERPTGTYSPLPSAVWIERTTNLTSVYSDTCLDGRLSRLFKLRRLAMQAFLHAKCGVQCAVQIVLVRDRHAEQREDALAGGLRNIAIVVMNRFHHELERGVDDRPRLFGIDALLKFHRAFDLGE